jgi:hypothetical protein
VQALFDRMADGDLLPVARETWPCTAKSEVGNVVDQRMVWEKSCHVFESAVEMRRVGHPSHCMGVPLLERVA